MSNWNPTTHPFRVRKIRRGGPHGWSDSVATFSTFEEAEVAMKARMTGGEYEAQLDRAKFDADGKWDGWIRVATRKIGRKVRKEEVKWW
jgi:hypothetical protein